MTPTRNPTDPDRDHIGIPWKVRARLLPRLNALPRMNHEEAMAFLESAGDDDDAAMLVLLDIDRQNAAIRDQRLQAADLRHRTLIVMLAIVALLNGLQVVFYMARAVACLQ